MKHPKRKMNFLLQSPWLRRQILSSCQRKEECFGQCWFHIPKRRFGNFLLRFEKRWDSLYLRDSKTSISHFQGWSRGSRCVKKKNDFQSHCQRVRPLHPERHKAVSPIHLYIFQWKSLGIWLILKNTCPLSRMLDSWANTSTSSYRAIQISLRLKDIPSSALSYRLTAESINLNCVKHRSCR